MDSEPLILKALALIALACLAAPGWTQIAKKEQPIQDALGWLRPKPDTLVRLVGYEKFPNRRVDLVSNAFFRWNPMSTGGVVQAEIQDYVNGAPARRLCADGRTVWSYSFAQNAYSASRYGAYGGPPPEGYRSTLMDRMTMDAEGNSAYLIRFLREIFAGDSAQYRTWFPGATVTLVMTDAVALTLGYQTLNYGQPAKDPVSGRWYTPGDQDFYVLYTFAYQPERSCAFHFIPPIDLGKPWRIGEIYYADSQRAGNQVTRYTDWIATVYSDPHDFPVKTNFVFVPPTNATPIAGKHGG